MSELERTLQIKIGLDLSLNWGIYLNPGPKGKSKSKPLILHIRILRSRKDEGTAQGHTGFSKHQRRNSETKLLTPKPEPHRASLRMDEMCTKGLYAHSAAGIHYSEWCSNFICTAFLLPIHSTHRIKHVLKNFKIIYVPLLPPPKKLSLNENRSLRDWQEEGIQKAWPMLLLMVWMLLLQYWKQGNVQFDPLLLTSFSVNSTIILPITQSTHHRYINTLLSIFFTQWLVHSRYFL